MKIPASKSISHRALILSAFAEKGSKIYNCLESEDTNATKNCLEKMGAEFSHINNGFEIHNNPSYGSESLSCGNSGTTLRLLTGIATLFDEKSILIGDDSLNKRPMKPLIDALKKMGSDIKDTKGHAPIFIQGKKTGNDTEIKGDVSSQYISSLIITAALQKDINSTIKIIEPIVSKPYIDLTIQMVKMLGIQVEEEIIKGGILIKIIGKKIKKMDFTVPADFSSAAFFIAAGCLDNNRIEIKGMNFDLPQADSKLLDIIKNMDGDIVINQNIISVRGKKLKNMDINIADCPDIFPILSVISSLTHGIITLSGAHHLKFKESDRISTTLEFLRNMGADVEAKDDGAIISSAKLIGNCTVNPYGDHRIAMAAAIAATFGDKPVEILNPSCVAVSYPNFFKDMQKLGAKLLYHD